MLVCLLVCGGTWPGCTTFDLLSSNSCEDRPLGLSGRESCKTTSYTQASIPRKDVAKASCKDQEGEPLLVPLAVAYPLESRCPLPVARESGAAPGHN